MSISSVWEIWENLWCVRAGEPLTLLMFCFLFCWMYFYKYISKPRRVPLDKWKALSWLSHVLSLWISLDFSKYRIFQMLKRVPRVLCLCWLWLCRWFRATERFYFITSIITNRNHVVICTAFGMCLTFLCAESCRISQAFNETSLFFSSIQTDTSWKSCGKWQRKSILWYRQRYHLIFLV